MNKGMFSSKTDDWETPKDFFDDLEKKFGKFDLDPCATKGNAKARRFFTKEDNGLEKKWDGRVFVNPPYGRTIGLWMKKSWESSRDGADLVVCLVPARTDTAWWHEYAMRGIIVFIRGRLKFGKSRNSAPFPSAVVIFYPKFGGL